MWTCRKCNKPVYFAERIQSLGFDWHPPCLVCRECGKKLHPGQHAEHAAEPYCHHPCYGALFGPRLFGHGTRNECHGAFGKVNRMDPERAHLDAKLKEFNQVFDGKPGEITCREVNGRAVLEGILRIHWAVNCIIHLKQEDQPAAPNCTNSSGGDGGGVERSRSNSSVNNNSGVDSDDDEPLWRDETPPRTPTNTGTTTPSTPVTPNLCKNPTQNPFAFNNSASISPSAVQCSSPNSNPNSALYSNSNLSPDPNSTQNPNPSPNSNSNLTPRSGTPTTLNPNWPPTPYPTLRPSISNSKISSLCLVHSNSSSSITDGPQSSPVLSYTHNAPRHAPISHPLSSVNVTDEDTNKDNFFNGFNKQLPQSDNVQRSENIFGSSNNPAVSNSNIGSNDLGDETTTLCREPNDSAVENNNTEEMGHQVFTEDFGPDSCYATMKTRTVRRRKNVDKSFTQSMRDSLLILGDPYDSKISGELSNAPPRPLNLEDAENSSTYLPSSNNNLCDNSSTEANLTKLDNETCASSEVNKNSLDSKNSNSNKGNSSNDPTATPATTSTLKRGGSYKDNNNTEKNKNTAGVVKRVSFSQVDWNEKLNSPRRIWKNVDDDSEYCDDSATTVVADGVGGGGGDGGACDGVLSSPVVDTSSSTVATTDGVAQARTTGGGVNGAVQTQPSKARAVLRRRPGRRMDKKKVKRRCSINGHLYLRETSSFHLSRDCPPAVVRLTSLTTSRQLIATVLEKYKIEMGTANFALYVVKDNGEQRRLSPTESPLTTRVLLGPHDAVARIVMCDADTTTDITPQMAEFLHLSLAECRAILRQYEHEEQTMIRAIRTKYDDMRFYMRYWMDQMESGACDITAAVASIG